MTVQTLTLTDFLLARIWDDETIARACGTTRASGTHPANVAAHIVRHDPARVLAECEAKRRIVAEHPAPSYIGTPGARLACDRCSDLGGPYGGDLESDWTDWPCPTLRALALPYADHPNYRQEWKP